MEKKIENGVNGLANRKFNFKYVETTWIDGNNISETEKNWSADNLNDFNRFREIWQELEVFDSNYKLTEFGTLLENGNVSMVLDYTLETDQRETIKFIRGISYEIAE
jgi:hypothetical protein